MKTLSGYRILVVLMAGIAFAGPVLAQTPNWVVDPGLYPSNMTMTTALYLDGARTVGTADRVAAFAGAELRGVAVPVDVGGELYFFLLVYGDVGTGQISFKAYDAAKDQVIDLNETVTFAVDGNAGTIANPHQLTGSRPQTLPGAVTLTSPTDGAPLVDSPVSLTWSTASNAQTYRVQVATDNGFSNLVLDTSVSTTEYTATLSPGVQFYWRVRGVNVAVSGNWSGTGRFTPKPDPPGAPVPLEPDNGATLSEPTASFLWSAVSGASSYQIQIASEASFATLLIDESTASTNYQATLQADQTLYWRVRATAGGATGAWSTPRSFNTPVEVGGLVLVSPTDGAANLQPTQTLSWGTASNATAYHVQVAVDAAFSTLVVESVVAGTSHDVTLSNGTTYYWRVRGQQDLVDGDWPAAFSFTTVVSVGTVQLVSPADGATLTGPTASFLWSAVSGASSYQIQIASQASFSTLLIDEATASTSYQAKLQAGQTFYWRARATAGGVAGDWSASRSLSTPVEVGQVVLASPADGASDLPQTQALTWLATGGASAYDVQVAADANFSSLVLETAVSGTSLVVSLATETRYYWRVRGRQDQMVGDWSRAFSFTTALPVNSSAAPILSTPLDQATIPSTVVRLEWQAVPGSDAYEVQVAASSGFRSLVANPTTQATTQTLTLATGVYFWRVRARAASVDGAWSEIRSFDLTLSVGTVSLISPADEAALTDPEVVFAWAEVTGVDSYQIQIATEVSFVSPLVDASIAATSYQTFLQSGVGLYWRVRAAVGAQGGNWSPPREFSVHVVVGRAALVSPADASTGLVSPVMLTWSAAANATGYDVQIATDAAFTDLALQVQQSGTSLTATLQPDMAYHWRVRGRDGSAVGDWTGSWLFATAGAGGELPAPILDSPPDQAELTGTEATLRWFSVANAGTYQLQISATSNFMTMEADVTTAHTTHTIKLPSGTRFWWRVRAFDGAAAGGWSSILSFRLLAATGTEEVPRSGLALYPGYPNPFAANSTVSYSLDRPQHVRLTLHDTLGRTLKVLDAGFRSQGSHQLRISGYGLPAGRYLYRLVTREGTRTRALTVVR